MTARRVDIVIEQGATYRFTFTWADTVVSNGVTTMVPKDLTGCGARMQIRTGYARQVLLEANTDNERIVLGQSNGLITVNIGADITDQAPRFLGPHAEQRIHRRARYDLEVVWPDGRVDRVLEGRVSFHPNITADFDTTTTTPFVPDAYYDAYYEAY